MRLTVFGATGGTGWELTGQATADDHHVRALCRSPEALPSDEAVDVVAGSVLDPRAVATAVNGADGVVCVLGRTSGNPRDVVSRGTENILAAMSNQGVRRLVVVTSMGLGASVRLVPWYVRLANATVLHTLMADKARQEEVVAASDLAWTIVRPGGLTDGPRTGEYVHGVDVDAAARPISRADVAEFLLRVVQTDMYVREAPVVTTDRDVDAAFLWEQATAVTRRLLGMRERHPPGSRPPEEEHPT